MYPHSLEGNTFAHKLLHLFFYEMCDWNNVLACFIWRRQVKNKTRNIENKLGSLFLNLFTHKNNNALSKLIIDNQEICFKNSDEFSSKARNNVQTSFIDLITLLFIKKYGRQKIQLLPYPIFELRYSLLFKRRNIW